MKKSPVRTLTVASKALKGKHVRVLVPMEYSNGVVFKLNEILIVTGTYRHGIHVKAPDGRVAYHVSVNHFELAE